MRILKRPVAVCLMFLLLLPLGVRGTAAAAEEENYTAFMTALGIYSAEDNMLAENEDILREEMASLISVFYGVTENAFLQPTPFADVPENWASGHIMTVVNMGIMSGYDDGLFRPQGIVKKIEAIKILVNMTGYGVLAEIKGGYPDGYTAVAQQAGILKGYEIKDMDQPITRGEFTRLLYQAVHVDLLRQVDYGERSEFQAQKGETLLTENLDIYKVSGHMNGAFFASLDYAEAPGRNKVRIDNVDYLCRFHAYPYLGTVVEGYYRYAAGDAIGELLYVEERQKGDGVIEVEADNIRTLSGSTLEYDENNRARKRTIPKDAVVIYNGVRNTYAALSDLKPIQGSVRLIDADSDGAYEYVIINDFVNYLIHSVSIDDGVYTITEESGKQPLAIDSNSQDVFSAVFDRDRAVSLDELKEGDVISVMADTVNREKHEVNPTSSVYIIYRSSNFFTGEITGKGTDTIEIDQTEYKTTEDYDADKYPLQIGQKHTFYVNHLGRIYAYDRAEAGSRYGILQAYKVRSGLDTTYTLRLFGEDGKFTDAMCKEKVTIDGYKQKGYEESLAYLKKASEQFQAVTGVAVPENGICQLVKYMTNEAGEITELDTIFENRVPTEDDLTYYGAPSSSLYLTYMANVGAIFSPVDTNTKQPAKAFGITPDTIGFLIGTDKTKQENYEKFSFSIFRSGTYTLKFFDADEMGVAKVAIRCVPDVAAELHVQEYTNLMIVEKVITKLGEDGMAAPYMEGILLNTGAAASVKLESESMLADAGIQPGDMVQWQLSYDGAVSTIRKALGSDGLGASVMTGANHMPGGNFSWDLRLSYGKALALSQSHLKTQYVSTNNDLYSYVEPCKINNTYQVIRVYIWDSEKRKLTNGTLGDIKTEEFYGADGADTIGSFYRSGRINAIVIYR